MPIPRHLVDFYLKLSSYKKINQFPYANYNKAYSCIFIHMPKVAGTSIARALGGARVKRNHLPWYVYYTANPYFYERAYKFSFVRNPWDRTLSAYHYLKNGGNKSGDLKTAELISKYTDFSDFLVRGLGEGHFRNHLLFLPQSDFIINGDQEIAVDFVGRYESLDQDFSHVMKRLGVATKLSKTNQSNRDKDYRCYYKNDASVRVVEDLYKQDILVLGYRF